MIGVGYFGLFIDVGIILFLLKCIWWCGVGSGGGGFFLILLIFMVNVCWEMLVILMMVGFVLKLFDRLFIESFIVLCVG